MKKLKLAIILLVPLFCLASAASADVIYDNLYSANDDADPLTGFGPPLFNSFSTGALGFNLADVQLLLSGSSSSGSLSLSLYSDSSTSPGALLLSIGTLSDNGLPSTLLAVDFPLGSSYALAANTRYWLVLDSTNGSTAVWSWSLDQSAVGVAGEYFGHGTSVFPNTEGPYQMRLSDTSAVPEPTTMILLGSGLISVLGLKRKLRKLPSVNISNKKAGP